MFLLADDTDHLIEVEEDDAQAFQQVQTLLDAGDPPLRAAVQHHATMIQEGLQAGLQPHDARRVGRVQHVHIDREADFQIRQLEQAFHQHFRLDGAVLGLKDQTYVFSRFIANIAQQRGLLVLYQVRQAFDQAAFLDLVGDFGDDDAPGSTAQVFGLPSCAQTNPATTGLIGLMNGRMALDRHAPGGEVRPRHQLHQLCRRGLGPIKQKLAGIDQLAHIVRRDRRGHTHGNA